MHEYDDELSLSEINDIRDEFEYALQSLPLSEILGDERIFWKIERLKSFLGMQR